MCENLIKEKTIFIIGAGVSAAALHADSPLSSWQNLISNGVDYLSKRSDTDDAKTFVSLYQENKEQNIPVIDFADMLYEVMGRQCFNNWLSGVCAEVKISDTKLLDFLIKSNKSIITTNYDTIIEERCEQLSIKRESLTWRDSEAKLLSLIQDGKPFIYHIHGRYDYPDSIIFTSKQYEDLLQNQVINKILEANILLNPLVFVGVGAGIADPDFTSKYSIFLISSSFSSDNNQHYILCSRNEEERISEICRELPIRPIAYGEKYSDLPEFLQSQLRRSEIVRKEEVIDEKIQEIIKDSAESLGIENPEDLILPLGLVEKNENGLNGIQHRISLSKILDEEKRHIILCADSNSGLTTALLQLNKLFCNKEYTVSFIEKKFDKRLNPEDDSQIFILDNFEFQSISKGKAIVGKIKKLNFQKIIFGVKQENINTVIELFHENEIEYAEYHLDKIRKTDIEKCVNVIFNEASQADNNKVVNRIFDTIMLANLPRNYSSVEKLLYLLKNNKQIDSIESQSDFLDTYCNSIMERIIDSPNFSNLRIVDLKTILCHLAYELIRNDKTYFMPSEIKEKLIEILHSLGVELKVNVTVFLDTLYKHSLLIYDTNKDKISFYNNSYLILFAGLALNDNLIGDLSSKFLEQSISDPIKYANVLISYAELNQNCSNIFEKVFKYYKNQFEKIVNVDICITNFEDENNAISSVDDTEEYADKQLQAKRISGDIADNLFQNFEYSSFRCSVILDSKSYDDFDKWIIILNLFSKIISSATRLNSSELKTSALSYVLEGWGLLYLNIIYNDKISSKLLNKIPVIRDSKDRNKFLYMLSTIGVVGGIYSSLNFDRLAYYFKDDISSNDIDMLCISFSKFIYFMLIRPLGWYGKVQRIYKYIKKIFRNKDIALIFLKIIENMYLFPYDTLSCPISNNDLNDLKSLYGDIIVMLHGSNNDMNNRVLKNSSIQKLDKRKELVVKYSKND